MKFTKFAVVTLFAALLMSGCDGAKVSFGDKENETPSNKGFLSISSLTVDCRIDENDPELGLSTRQATRGSVDVANFDCSIINESGTVVKSFKYSERPTEPIELNTGDYIFKMQSGEVPAAAWDTPVYGTVEPFKIVRNDTTTIPELVCSLMQIKVSISYDPTLLERLGPLTLTTVSVGENSLEYKLTEERAGFFLAPQVYNTISLRIWGTYAADKKNFKNIEMTKEIRNVKAGQYSKVHFFLEHEAEGSVKIGVTLRDWVTDEIIPCNVADLVKEEEWIENEGGNDDNDTPATPAEDPSIVWDGHDISKRVPITSGLSVDLLVSASKGIKEFTVKIESASLTPAELAGVGLCDVLDLCYPTKSYDSNNPGTYIDVEEPLRGLGFAVGEDVVNKTFVKLSITQFMGVLQGVSGTSLKNHDFVLTVVDNEGNTTVKTLMLQTGK